MHSSGQLLYRDSFISWSDCMYISVEGVNILNYCILLQLTMLYNTEYFGQYTWIYFSKYFTKNNHNSDNFGKHFSLLHI